MKLCRKLKHAYRCISGWRPVNDSDRGLQRWHYGRYSISLCGTCLELWMQIALRVLVKIMAHAYPRPSGVNVHWNFQESFATSNAPVENYWWTLTKDLHPGFCPERAPCCFCSPLSVALYVSPGNVKNTSGSGVWRNDRGQCKYFHRTTSNDIWWYLTDVRHGSEMRYNRRQKTILYELSSGYMYIRKKNPTCHWWTKALSENTTHDSQIYLRIFFSW